MSSSFDDSVSQYMAVIGTIKKSNSQEVYVFTLLFLLVAA